MCLRRIIGGLATRQERSTEFSCKFQQQAVSILHICRAILDSYHIGVGSLFQIERIVKAL